MRLTEKLVQIAAVIAAASGCGGTTTASTATHGDGGTTEGGGGPGDSGFPGDGGNPGDAAPDTGVIGCGGCGCGGGDASPPMHTVTAAAVCSLMEESREISTFAFGQACQSLCMGGGYVCDIPQSFVSDVQVLNPDAGAPADGGPWQIDCPTSPSMVTVTCTVQCTGRLTEGYCAPGGVRGDAERLAAMAYLEAVSVHAFERLERELAAHGAPANLRRDARRARPADGFDA